MNIDRTLFWFKDVDEILLIFNESFFSLGNLMNRLLNEKYNGKKIKFINIDFSTEKTYERFPELPKDTMYFYNGHLRYYGVFDKDQFCQLNKSEQNKYIWDNAFTYLSRSAKSIKNENLFAACQYAYQKGIELNLNPDYRMIDTELNLYGTLIKASLWINFKEDGMYSKLILEKDDKVIYERQINKAKNGIEPFLEMYKGIFLQDNTLIIKGAKDEKNRPLKIPLEDIRWDI